MSSPDDVPEGPCFGKLDRVFPMGEDGLRQSPEACFSCYCKTECLRAALSGREGLTVHEESVDRAYRSGMIGFIHRWSRKKEINKRRKSS